MADKAGRLDRVITLQKRTVSQNAFGEKVDTFSDDQDMRAQLVEYGNGDEDYEAKQETAVTELVFRVRYKEKLNEEDYRIKHNGKVFNIKRVMEDLEGYRRQYMKIICDAR
jgi:SPP1 family predicted phage head-tail adaptor